MYCQKRGQKYLALCLMIIYHRVTMVSQVYTNRCMSYYLYRVLLIIHGEKGSLFPIFIFIPNKLSQLANSFYKLS